MCGLLSGLGRRRRGQGGAATCFVLEAASRSPASFEPPCTRRPVLRLDFSLEEKIVKLSRTALAAVALVAASGALFAETRGDGPKGLALGVFLGEPTGITLRWGFADNQSFEGKAAWSFAEAPNRGDTSFIFQTNYLMELPGIVIIKTEDFPLYVGVGAQTQLGNVFTLALRFPVGILYRFKSAPLELFLELGLGMQLFPSTDFVGSGGLGLRYRF